MNQRRKQNVCTLIFAVVIAGIVKLSTQEDDHGCGPNEYIKAGTYYPCWARTIFQQYIPGNLFIIYLHSVRIGIV